jgi:hypothetical protein
MHGKLAGPHVARTTGNDFPVVAKAGVAPATQRKRLSMQEDKSEGLKQPKSAVKPANEQKLAEMKAAAREHGRCFKCGRYFPPENRIRYRQECHAPRHTFVSNMGKVLRAVAEGRNPNAFLDHQQP